MRRRARTARWRDATVGRPQASPPCIRLVGRNSTRLHRMGPAPAAVLRVTGWVSPGGPAAASAASHLRGPKSTSAQLDHLPSSVTEVCHDNLASCPALFLNGRRTGKPDGVRPSGSAVGSLGRPRTATHDGGAAASVAWHERPVPGDGPTVDAIRDDGRRRPGRRRRPPPCGTCTLEDRAGRSRLPTRWTCWAGRCPPYPCQPEPRPARSCPREAHRRTPVGRPTGRGPPPWTWRRSPRSRRAAR